MTDDLATRVARIRRERRRETLRSVAKFTLIIFVILIASHALLSTEFGRDLYCTGRIDAVTPGCGR